MITIKNPTFGSDFEMFLQNKNGKIISAVGRIGGTKDEPLSLGENCYRQEDNVLFEANIPPVTTEEDWIKYIDYCIEKSQKDILDEQELTLVPASSFKLEEDQLQHPQAKAFGCSPSKNAWSKEMTPAKEAPNDGLRSAGFHVHVGFRLAQEDDPSYDDIYKLIRYFDLYLGIPSIILDPDTERRNLYGEAGDFRFKSEEDDTLFIVEYRSLGSYMLNYKKFVFTQMLHAIDAFNVGEEEPGYIIKEIIDNSDVEGAKEICKQYMIEVPETLQLIKEEVNG